MSDKVVYLFGAGASYNAIPVVSGMGMRLKTFLNYFKHYREYEDKKIADAEDNIEDKWYSLVEDVIESYSIDTLARRSWLSNDTKRLSEIKQLIGAYILWEQIVKPDYSSFIDFIEKSSMLSAHYKESTNRFNYFWDGSIIEDETIRDKDIKLKNYDYRYESLLSVIADKPYKLSDRYSFVSWNYDNQVEIAINRIFNLEGFSNRDGSDNEGWKDQKMHAILGNNFVKLNGSASNSNFDFEPISRFNTSRKNKELGRIYKFLTGKENFDHRILFAWEESMEFDRKRALSLLKEAKHIVIIGYSFPEYNRQIDKQLIEAATTGLNKEIVVQDREDNIERIVSRINSIRPNLKVRRNTDLNQFYIPL